MHAMLPESAEGATIAGMLVGETAYTLPWAMYADSNRRLWLNPDYPADKKPHGTAQMRIDRTPQGFRVRGVRGHTYSPGSGWSNGLRVVEFNPA